MRKRFNISDGLLFCSLVIGSHKCNHIIVIIYAKIEKGAESLTIAPFFCYLFVRGIMIFSVLLIEVGM